MPNHPNRSRLGSQAENPSPCDVIAGREEVRRLLKSLGTVRGEGITDAQLWCAKAVYTSIRSWQQWEAEAGTSGHRRMHPAFWDLFKRKVREAKAHVESGGVP